MIFVFYFFAAILVWLSFKSFLGGLAYLNFFRKQLAKPRSEFTPFASVIVPCRGIDKGLSENLTAFLNQDYPQYEVIFVVDDENDPAVAVIDAIIPKAETRPVGSVPTARLIVASKAINSAQKAENLRDAVLHVSPESQIFVFADSRRPPVKGLAKGTRRST